MPRKHKQHGQTSRDEVESDEDGDGPELQSAQTRSWSRSSGTVSESVGRPSSAPRRLSADTRSDWRLTERSGGWSYGGGMTSGERMSVDGMSATRPSLTSRPTFDGGPSNPDPSAGWTTELDDFIG